MENQERIKRENILNNNIVLQKAITEFKFKGVPWNGTIYFLKSFISDLFKVDERTIERLIESNKDELENSGYRVISDSELTAFLSQFDTDINVGIKTRKLGIYSFRAVLNIAMLLQNSEPAKIIRSKLLDLTLNTLKEKTNGNYLYINQRDANFLETLYSNNLSRTKFTKALNEYVDMGAYKYEYFTNLIYKGIFSENAKEYQQILRLESQSNLRDTMYVEVLQNISAIEAGIAQDIESKSNNLGRLLNKNEVESLIHNLINHASMLSYIELARNKMASRDLCFRDSYHKKLHSYISSVNPDDFNKFLGKKSKSLSQQIDDHIDVFKRLKDK